MKLKSNILWILVIIFFLFSFFLIYFFDQKNIPTKFIYYIDSLVNKNFKLSLIIFFLLSTFSIAINLPTFILLCLIGGYYFDIYFGFIISLVAITLGSTFTFLISKFFSEKINLKRIKITNSFSNFFYENKFFCLVLLRYSFLFPIFIENIIAGLLKPKLSIFLISTIIGISPIVYFCVSFGNNLKNILSYDTFSLVELFDIQNIILFVLFVLFILIISFSKKKMRGIF